MAFRQHHRPQPSRQLSFHQPEQPAEVGPVSSPQRKRALEDSEEWILFSPVAPESTTANTHTTSTERTPRTAGLSRLSDFGSLDTAARSEQGDDDDITCQGTEEELDSLDDGLHAFHEPSEYGASPSRLEESGNSVLPTHDGLGSFQPSATMQEHLWRFERQTTRRPHTRRRSSVQRRLDALEEAEEVTQEQDRRQRIEKWRIEQSRALLEEIERETRRRRRMSVVSAARSRTDSAFQETQPTISARAPASVSDAQSESSDDSTENLSFWERLTRRVIRDLMGIDEDTLSVIFGESLPEEAMSIPEQAPVSRPPPDLAIGTFDISSFPGEPWEHRLLERVARELGILVHQLSEHPGAFSTYQRAREAPEYAGLSITTSNPTQMTGSSPLASTQSSAPSPTAALLAASLPNQQSANAYSEASLWGIEEESESPALNSFRTQPQAANPNTTEELAQERAYWEQELDVKMVFKFLVKRFSSRRTSVSSQSRRNMNAAPGQPRASTGVADSESVSARRAAIIRQHHPLVSSSSTDRALPSSSNVNSRENRRKELLLRHQTTLRNQILRSSESCASQSTKKSKRSASSGRNYWDLGGSVGSGSVLAGEV